VKGLIFRNNASRLHDTGEHPERIERIIAAENLLEQQDWCGYEVVDSPLAEETALLRAHTPRLIEHVRMAAEQSLPLDPDTPAVPASYRAALASAGGAVALVEALCDRSCDVGASLHRPPGHHAEADRSMGFCLFNNAAVAALAAIEEHGLERVLIFDWDVHHGNGTEAIFAADPRVCFISVHQSPCYPGSGRFDEQGIGEGLGYTINCPVPPGSGDELWLGLVEQLVLPVVAAYRPQLILLSAGFDAHVDDPLAECTVSDAGFEAMARAIREIAERFSVPVGLLLEGGYNVDALARSLALTLLQLRGVQSQPTGFGDAPALASELAEAVLSRPVFNEQL